MIDCKIKKKEKERKKLNKLKLNTKNDNKIKILNKKGKNQVIESSGVFPLISSPGANISNRVFLSVSVPS
jgi:hypothetical protein